MQELKNGLNADKFAPPWMFPKSFFLLIRCTNDLYTLYNRLNASVTISKNMKTCESGLKRKGLFVIFKATFTKTAIKPKFVDRFSLKLSTAAIDQCTIKSRNFVSIENVL